MRLNRSFSMKQHAEFSRARLDGEAKGGRYLVLSTLVDQEATKQRPTDSSKKAGVIVTKKVGNAVTRNLLRRRIQAILAKYIDRIDDQGGTRYIVTIIRWRAPDATFSELEKDWLKQANRLGILAAS